MGDTGIDEELARRIGFMEAGGVDDCFQPSRPMLISLAYWVAGAAALWFILLVMARA